MKNIFYTFIIICLLFSCRSNNKQKEQDTVKVKSPSNQSNAFIKKFKPLIQGVWVKKDYIDMLSKNRSPYTSFKGLQGIAEFEIHLPDVADSTNIGYSLNNHEGAEFVLFFKSGQKPNSLKTSLPDYKTKGDFYELGYNVTTGKDTTIVFYHYSQRKQIIDSSLYVKVAQKADDSADAGWGVDYITNKKLIIGSYLGTDSTSSSLKIEFKSNGKLDGFHNFKNYLISTDFEAGPANNLDQIGIYESDFMKAKWYSFKFDKDTLNLYDMYSNTDSTLLFVGKRIYKLVKQK